MGMMADEASAQVEKLLGMYPRVVRAELSDEIIDEFVQALMRAQEEVISLVIAELKVTTATVVAAVQPLTEEEFRVLVMESLRKVRQQHAFLMAAPSPSGTVH